MTPELVVRQRQLVGVNVVFHDATRYAKYVFPFFDVRWRVRLFALDLLGERPRLWEGHARYAGRKLEIDSPQEKLTPAASADVARFEGLLHFDPWWAFKGAGLPEPLVRAVVPTNIAGRFHPMDVPRRIVDVAFGASFDKLSAVEAENERFERRKFVEGGLDLGKLRA